MMPNKTTLLERFVNKNVTDPLEGWEFVLELCLQKPPSAELLAEVTDAFMKQFHGGFVVNGCVVPEIARRFKSCGYPLDIVKGQQGVYQVTVSCEGCTFVLYRDRTLMDKLVTNHVEQRLRYNWLRSLWQRWYSRIVR